MGRLHVCAHLCVCVGDGRKAAESSSFKKEDLGRIMHQSEKLVSTLREWNVEKTSVLPRAILSLGQMFSAWPRGDRAFLGSL